MKFLQTVTAFLLPLTALAAKKGSTDKFSDYRSQQLAAAAPLKLDDNEYSKLTSSPRDYSVAVLLTALESRFGCTICHEFQPEWDLLGKSWAKGDKKKESRLVMGTLDFVNGQRTFQSLQLTTAPVLLYFPPTTGPDAKPDTQPLRFDFTTGYYSRPLPPYQPTANKSPVSLQLSPSIPGSLAMLQALLPPSPAQSTTSRSSPPP
jgi:oligosaccharyltransferase complex subunit gamma